MNIKFRKLWIKAVYSTILIVLVTIPYQAFQSGLKKGMQRGYWREIRYVEPVNAIDENIQSIVYTNFLDHPYQYSGKDPIDFVVPTKIFTVAHTCYTDQFAQEYGYSKEYVRELSPHLQAIGLYLGTRGIQTHLYVHLLIDNKKGVLLPKDRDLNYQRSELREKIHLPERISGYVMSLQEKQLIEKSTRERLKYENNISLAYALDLDQAWQKSNVSFRLMQSSHRVFKDLHFISLRLDFDKQTLNWLKQSYISVALKSAEHKFAYFKIPEHIQKKIFEVMEGYENYSFEQLIQASKKEGAVE